MKYSGVGGQAVMEGVMMKNQDRYAVAVRKPDHQIDVKVENYKSTIKNEKIRHLPIVRGVVNFVESLVLGMSTLMYSASFFEDEEEDNKKKNLSEEERRKLEEKGMVSCVKEKCIYQWKTLPNSLSYQFLLLTGWWKE